MTRIPETAANDVYRAAHTAITMGVTAKEFLIELREAWATVLAEKARHDDHVFKEATL